MNTLDKKYQELLQDILDNGIKKEDRTGTGTISVFGRQIRHKMSEGFPLLTTKKMYWKGIVTELLWFLRGDTNIKFLVDNNCHIWDGDAYKNYLHKVIRDKDIIRYLKSYSVDTNGVPTIEPYSKDEFIERIKTDDEFAKKWGDLGPVYGRQWRNWDAIFDGGVDQIANLIHDLKTNPDSRRLMVSAWNVGELGQMTLPPCHYGFQVYTRELSASERSTYKISKKTELFDSHELYDFIKNNENVTIDLDDVVHKECDEMNIPTRAISLMFNMRSNDVPLGLPFNLASYGLLLEILAKEVNMVPDELIASLGDVHIYSNQVDAIKEQLTREPYPLPKLVIDQFDETNHYIGDMDDISEYNISQFKLENYQSHPVIKIPLSN